MPNDLDFAAPRQPRRGGDRNGCWLRAPSVDLQVASGSGAVKDVGRTYTCTVTAEEYRRQIDGDTHA